MGKINKLSSLLIKQIAAGECIERPASVVKELLENSLDAKSTRIKIDIEDAGNRLIRITDNGTGIEREDLLLAVTSHATSKIQTVEDLYSISSLGFRGEALASIASVAEFSIASTTQEGEGFLLESKNDQISPVRPIGMDLGTCVEVRNLFFNIPARRKFLKSKNVEMAHIKNTVKYLALTAPKVSFTLSHNSKILFSVGSVKTLGERIRDILKKDDLDFFRIEKSLEHSQLIAYLGMPNYHKSNNNSLFYYINGRYVKDRIVTRAIGDAYKDYLPSRRFPVAVVYLTLDPQQVDVNVHPTKSEVRYRNSQEIYRFVYKTCLQNLQKETMVADIPFESHKKKQTEKFRGEQVSLDFSDSQRNFSDSQNSDSFSDSQRSFSDSQRSFSDSQRSFSDSQRSFSDSQRSFSDSQNSDSFSDSQNSDSQRSFSDSQNSDSQNSDSFSDSQNSDSQRSFSDSQIIREREEGFSEVYETVSARGSLQTKNMSYRLLTD